MEYQNLEDLLGRIIAARERVNREIRRHSSMTHTRQDEEVSGRLLTILNFKSHCLTLVYFSLRRIHSGGESEPGDMGDVLELLQAIEDSALLEDLSQNAKHLKRILQIRLDRRSNRGCYYRHRTTQTDMDHDL